MKTIEQNQINLSKMIPVEPKNTAYQEKHGKSHLFKFGQVKTLCGIEIIDFKPEKYFPIINNQVKIPGKAKAVQLASVSNRIGCNSCVNGALMMAKGQKVSV